MLKNKLPLFTIAFCLINFGILIAQPTLKTSDPSERAEDGNGSVVINGELKQWHKVTLTMDGPFAHELDKPSPFINYRMMVTFIHESGSPKYEVPGYFAADGNASESSADSGTKWRAHLSPDKTGKWIYQVHFLEGNLVAVMDVDWAQPLAPYHGVGGNFEVGPSDKGGLDLRGKGRLEYVGERYLQFQGNGEYFLKAGADAPESLLAYTDFDGTYSAKKKGTEREGEAFSTNLKSWEPHIKDWQQGNPTWKNGKGKGLIGAVNYLSKKGVNVFSFLTYNAGGDGDNVWPFVERNSKYHYDCSKLDQWGILFDYATTRGMYLHFKTQETEIDDRRSKGKTRAYIPEALDGGKLGPQRMLYYRELIARYGYLLALNWNLGEENTQSVEEQRAMAAYFKGQCPYPHNIVLHTYPNKQDNIYPQLLGANSELTGVSLQNPWHTVHARTLQWIKASNDAGKKWVVANDEQNQANRGVPPDAGYQGFDPDSIGYDNNDIRKQTLWGNLLAGGAGVEYYFGYQLPENDLKCEDFRSRDQSWDYCRMALEFFKRNNIPFWEMENKDDLVGNPEGKKEKYCFAKAGEMYIVYFAYTNETTLDLNNQEGNAYSIHWYNPRTGGALTQGTIKNVRGGKTISLKKPNGSIDEDWVALLKKM